MIKYLRTHLVRQNRKAVLQYDFELAKDKVLMGVERKSLLLTDEEKKNTASPSPSGARVAAGRPASPPAQSAPGQRPHRGSR